MPPPHKPSTVVAKSELAGPKGFPPVNPLTFRSKKFDNVFIIGDKGGLRGWEFLTCSYVYYGLWGWCGPSNVRILKVLCRILERGKGVRLLKMDFEAMWFASYLTKYWMLRLGFTREALSYLTDPKVLRICANIAYFLRFLIKATGEIRNLGIPMFKGHSASFSSARKWEYKRRGALMPPYFLFLQLYYVLDF